jgi:hypothetical protein
LDHAEEDGVEVGGVRVELRVAEEGVGVAVVAAEPDEGGAVPGDQAAPVRG